MVKLISHWLAARWQTPGWRVALAVGAVLAVAVGIAFGLAAAPPRNQSSNPPARSTNSSSPRSGVKFADNFTATSTLQEAGSMRESSSPDWWLNSGGLFYSRGGYAQTIEGALATGSRWQREYAASNPTDTDNGRHPQNIFRLVTRSQFRNLTQQAYFRVDADELSMSPQRAASNGLLFFNRYQNGDNLYYTGLRVDGSAVIKKKIAGTYYTMAQTTVLPGTYNHDSNPDLLPKHVWIGLRSTVVTNADGSVTVALWSDLGHVGGWKQLVTATDTGHEFGGAAITSAGYGGIRTDFMDVSFRAYTISTQPN